MENEEIMMSTDNMELLCAECRKRVRYHVYKRKAARKIKDIDVEYEEFYGICDDCKSEIFVPGLDDMNIETMDNAYRKKKELITVAQIKEILRRYNIEKRPLSKLLGFGDITITRYIDGQLPSAKYSEILIDVLNNEQHMKKYVEANKDTVSKVTLKKVSEAIDNISNEKRTNNSAEKIALYVVSSGNEVTNLFLQKVLYYVKGISKIINGESIIAEPCEAWRFGPVFPSVYEKYKDFGKQEIEVDISKEYVEGLLSEPEKKITDYVLSTFGIYNAWFLKDLTHLEKPWIDARKGLSEDDPSRNLMDDQVIFDYFSAIDKRYYLKESKGVEKYISDMKRKMLSC